MPLWVQSGQTVPREGRDRYRVALQAVLAFHVKMGTIKDRNGMCKVQFWRGRKGKTTSTEVGYLYSGKEGQQSA